MIPTHDRRTSTAIATLGLLGILFLGLSLAIAARPGGDAGKGVPDVGSVDNSTEYWRRTRLPHGLPRPEGLSPFGDLRPGFRGPMDRPGLLATGAGFLDTEGRLVGGSERDERRGPHGQYRKSREDPPPESHQRCVRTVARRRSR